MTEHIYSNWGATPSSVLDTASALVNGDRAAAYGNIREQYDTLAALWSQVFETDVNGGQVILAMMQIKMARLIKNPTHRDSLVDVAGYALVYEKYLEQTQ